METVNSMLADAPPGIGHREVVSPHDLTPIARVPTHDWVGVDHALARAHHLFRDRSSWLPPAERIAILERTVALMQSRIEELTKLAAREGGKPWNDSRVEVVRAIDSIQWCIDSIKGRPAEPVPMNLNAASANKVTFSIDEPVGVVVAISAFNHPLNLITHQVGPAVAAGCPVIVKPAEDTPLSCFRFVQLLREAGLPDDWCQAVMTDSLETASRLVSDERTGFLSFIGSPGVGWKLRSMLAPGARCALEHGGSAPVIVDDTADLDVLLPKLLKGGFYHAGQVCVSVQRVFAPAAVARELGERLAREAAALKVGDPADVDTEVGPLIRPAEVARVDEWVKEAIEAGAERLCGGEPLSETYYPCTVLYQPPADSRVSREEIFGPVVAVYPYDDLNAAIAQANSLPSAFQAAVFTQRLDTAMNLSRNLDASAVMINEHTAFRVDWMPFAGLRQSGLGTGGIPYTYDDMTVRKMVVLDMN